MNEPPIHAPPAIPPANPSHTWEILCHLSAVSMFLGVPFGHLLGPLLFWLIKKDELPSVDAHGKESLNFQLSITLYFVVLLGATVGLMCILVGVLLVPLLILAAAVGPVVDAVFVIIATIEASKGNLYRYPATIRFLK